MAKAISFDEFLKEGTLVEENVNNVPEVEVEKPIRIVPETPVSDKEMKAFWKQVRHFFRTGQRPPGRLLVLAFRGRQPVIYHSAPSH